MSEKNLSEHLEQLTRELDALPSDADARTTVASLIADIRVHLAGGVVEEPLPEQLQNAASNFEVEHPSVAGVLNSILVSLSNIGV